MRVSRPGQIPHRRYRSRFRPLIGGFCLVAFSTNWVGTKNPASRRVECSAGSWIATTSAPPAFTLRVLYSFQPIGIRLPDREYTAGIFMLSLAKLTPINDTTDNDPPILQYAYLDSKELILESNELPTPGNIKNSRFKLRADKRRIRVTSASIPADDSIAILEPKSTIPFTSNKNFTHLQRSKRRSIRRGNPGR